MDNVGTPLSVRTILVKEKLANLPDASDLYPSCYSSFANSRTYGQVITHEFCPEKDDTDESIPTYDKNTL